MTEVFKFDRDHLAATVFEGDENAPRDEEGAKYRIESGFKPENVFFLPAEDNWWGLEYGPCGPDSEMFYVSDKALDLVVTGMDSSKACFIITSEPEWIKSQILTAMERGVTGWKVIGEYSGSEKRLLLCVVSSRETVTLKRIVKSGDPAAFVFTCDTHEALGEGFNEL